MIEMIDVLKSLGASVLVFGLIHFIVCNIFRNINFKRRALVSLITGMSLTIIVALGIVYDYFKNGILVSFSDGFKIFFYYYSFLIVSFLYAIILPLVFFIIGIKKNQAFRDFKIKVEKSKTKVKPDYTINDKHDYVYAIIKMGTSFLLKKDGESYTSIIERLKGNYLFHDDMIRHIIEEYALESDIRQANMYKMVGCLRVLGDANNNKSFDETYYCYVISIDYISDKIKGFEEVSEYDLLSYNMRNLDKQILYRTVMGTQFDVEVKEEDL